MKKSDVLVPKDMEMAYEQFHFAPAVRAGGFLLCSGQLGTDERFAIVSSEPEAQFVQAFENVKRVLAAAKLDFGARLRVAKRRGVAKASAAKTRTAKHGGKAAALRRRRG